MTKLLQDSILDIAIGSAMLVFAHTKFLSEVRGDEKMGGLYGSRSVDIFVFTPHRLQR